MKDALKKTISKLNIELRSWSYLLGRWPIMISTAIGKSTSPSSLDSENDHSALSSGSL